MPYLLTSALRGGDGRELGHCGNRDKRCERHDIRVIYARMDLARLTIFRDVARCGSIAGAARSIGLDASVVSRSLAALEAEVGLRLVQRTTRRLELTEAGQIYLDRIEPLIEELVSAREAAARVVEQPQGRVKVTASSAYGETVIAPLLASFQRRYPAIDIDLLLTDDLVDLVAQHVDLAVRLGPKPTGDMIVARLATTQKRLVASPDYVATAAALVIPADTTNHRCLISSADRQTKWLFRRDGTDVWVPVAARVATSNTLALKRCAMDGMGLAVLSDWLVDAEIASGRLVEPLTDWQVATSDFESGVWIVYPSRSFLPAKVRVFIDHLRSARVEY